MIRFTQWSRNSRNTVAGAEAGAVSWCFQLSQPQRLISGLRWGWGMGLGGEETN